MCEPEHGGSNGAGAAKLPHPLKAAVYRVVDAGGVDAMAELLLSGVPALQHRAASVLADVSRFPRGAAAMLQPLGEAAAATGGAHGGNRATVFLLCLLLAQGRDPSDVAAGAVREGHNAAAAIAGRAAQVPAPVIALCTAAVRRALKHAWPAVAGAAAATPAPALPVAEAAMGAGADASDGGALFGSGDGVAELASGALPASRAFTPVAPDVAAVNELLRSAPHAGDRAGDDDADDDCAGYE
jgi:hypothetical protein